MSTDADMNTRKGLAAPAKDEMHLGGAKVALIASRFNAFVVDRLIDGARRSLNDYGISLAESDIVRVPGAFELPLAARTLANTGNYDGLVALGAVIRGETAHFDYVCSECASGLMRVSLDYGLPIGFGVLTVDTEGQALARAGDSDNKGAEAVQAVVEMIAILRRTR